MLDIRPLLLATAEDHYAPAPAMREAERLLFPLLCGRGQAAAIPAIGRVARQEEVLA